MVYLYLEESPRSTYISLTLPTQPLAIHVRPLIPQIRLKRPLEHRGPRQILFIFISDLSEDIPLARDVMHVDFLRVWVALHILGNGSGFTQRAFALDESWTEIRPVSGRVKG